MTTNQETCLVIKIRLQKELEDTKSHHQQLLLLIINITLSEDLTKDKKLAKNSENSPFDNFYLKFQFLRLSSCCNNYCDHIEVCDCSSKIQF